MKPQLTGLVLVILVALGFALLLAPPPNDGPGSSATPARRPENPAVVSSVRAESSPSAPVLAPSDLEGVWAQYADKDGEAVLWSKLKLTRNASGVYEATTLEVTKAAASDRLRTFDHRYDGDKWTFQAEWHDRGPSQLELQRQGSGEFEGHALVKGEEDPTLFTFKKESP